VFQPLLPSLFEPEDAEEILTEVLKNSKNKYPNQNVHIFCNTVVLTEQFIQKLTKPFDSIIQKKAEKVCVPNISHALTFVHYDNLIQPFHCSDQGSIPDRGRGFFL
jgi:hypothetical protein